MLPERIAARIQHLLASVPDPETAERYLLRMQSESPSAFGRIAASPAALRAAVHLFAHSRFLSDSVLRYPERILQVANSGSFYRSIETEEFEERLLDSLGGERHDGLAGIELARFRRRQLLRIVLRDVLGAASLSDITKELSSLA